SLLCSTFAPRRIIQTACRVLSIGAMTTVALHLRAIGTSCEKDPARNAELTHRLAPCLAEAGVAHERLDVDVAPAAEVHRADAVHEARAAALRTHHHHDREAAARLRHAGDLADDRGA